jgi:hypothetical protein
MIVLTMSFPFFKYTATTTLRGVIGVCDEICSMSLYLVLLFQSIECLSNV